MDMNRVVNVVIASPGDVVIERKIVHEACLGLNESELLHHLGVSLHTGMWEDVFPSAEPPQVIINRLIDECDILVCIFYKRFYTQSGRTESENLNNFLLAYDVWKSLKKPHVMLFFREAQTSSTEDTPAPVLREMCELKEMMEKEKLLYTDVFSAPHEFCEKIYDQIEKWVRDNTTRQ